MAEGGRGKQRKGREKSGKGEKETPEKVSGERMGRSVVKIGMRQNKIENKIMVKKEKTM